MAAFVFIGLLTLLDACAPRVETGRAGAVLETTNENIDPLLIQLIHESEAI